MRALPARRRLAPALLAATAFAAAAAAQDANVDYAPSGWMLLPTLPTVGDRQRPELTGGGLDAGGFRLYPSLSIAGVYDDNIFATETNETDDFYGLAIASARLRSDWNVHAVGLEASAEVRRYTDTDSENAENGRVAAFGRLDLPDDTALFAAAEYRNDSESREDPEDRSGPLTEIDTFSASSGVTRNFGVLGVDATGTFRTLSFAPDTEADRDRDEAEARLTLRYAYAPRFTPFVRASYLQRDFDRDLDRSGLNRDAERYGGALGVRILITDIVSGEAAVGYSETAYDDPLLDDFGALTASAAVTWNPTRLTSVVAAANREELPTTLAGASSRTVTDLSLRVEHELLREVVLTGSVFFGQDEWEGIDRIDDRFGASVSAEWRVSRNAQLFIRAAHTTRESDAAGEDFSRNTVSAGLRLSL